jgi:hypothetical protein
MSIQKANEKIEALGKYVEVFEKTIPLVHSEMKRLISEIQKDLDNSFVCGWTYESVEFLFEQAENWTDVPEEEKKNLIECVMSTMDSEYDSEYGMTNGKVLDIIRREWPEAKYHWMDDTIEEDSEG